MPARGSVIRRFPEVAVEARAVLAALPDPVLVVDEQGMLRYANLAAEEFFDAGTTVLLGLPLAGLLPEDSPVFGLIDSVRRTGASVSEYGLVIDMPRIGPRTLAVQAAPMGDGSDLVVVSLQGRSIADKIDRQLTHRNAARSVTAMASMLAHEVKNPLSGIRGAAQLLEENASQADRELTRLICDESRSHLRLWSIAWMCSPIAARSSERRSISTRCSSGCAGRRNRASRAMFASSRNTIPRCRR